MPRPHFFVIVACVIIFIAIILWAPRCGALGEGGDETTAVEETSREEPAVPEVTLEETTEETQEFTVLPDTR